MATRKVTFTLDEDTLGRIDRTAARLRTSKSQVVREAIAEYAARAGRLLDAERDRLLAVYDRVTSAIPERPAAEVDREVAAVRQARRRGTRDPL